MSEVTDWTYTEVRKPKEEGWYEAIFDDQTTKKPKTYIAFWNGHHFEILVYRKIQGPQLWTCDPPIAWKELTEPPKNI